MKRCSQLTSAVLFLALGLLLPLLRTAAAEEAADGRVSLYIKAGDPNGGRLFFRWAQLEGPAVKIAEPAAARLEPGTKKWISDTYFVPTEAGKYVFEVTVTNQDGVETKRTFTREVVPAAPAPTAVAGKEQDKSISEIVVLNGIGSHAAPGLNIEAWEWRIVTAPEKFKIEPKQLKERHIDFKAVEAGVYTFELRVSDGKRWSAPSRTSVTVKPAPQPPQIEEAEAQKPAVELPRRPELTNKALRAVVNAGRTVKVNETVVLDGSASAIPEGERPQFFWKQERRGIEPLIRTLQPDKSKPCAAGRTDGLAYPVWTCVLPAPGEYTFVLEITGKNGDAGRVESDPVTFVAQAENHPPTARIFAERTNVEVGDVVKLDGSKSTDPDGNKLTYVWGPVAGKRAPHTWIGTEGPLVQFRAEEEGEYTVALTVGNGQLSSQDTVTVAVAKVNLPPTVKLPERYEGFVKEQINMQALVSDPQNDPYTVRWTCVDPATVGIPEAYATRKTLAFVPQNPGTYIFRCTASKSNGKSGSAETTVLVRSTSLVLPPTAVIDGPEKVALGDKVKLSGARSADPAKKPLGYAWAQEPIEGGPKIAAPAPSGNTPEWVFTVTEPGQYRVALVVSNGTAASEADRFEFTVAAGHRPPVAAIAAPAATSVNVGEKMTLDGSGSASPDGAKLSFKWRKLEGKGGVEITDADQPSATLTATAPGSVKIELTVSDGKFENTARQELTLVRVNRPPVAKLDGPAEHTFTAGDKVALDASGSSAPDGGKLSIKWSVTAGAELVKLDPRGARATVLALHEGTAEITAVANDGALDSVPVVYGLTIKAPKLPPVAKIVPPASSQLTVGEQLTLDGSASNSPDGGPLTYTWRKVSGRGEIEIETTDHDHAIVTGRAPGAVKLELAVSDGQHPAARATADLTVVKAVHAPAAKIAGAPKQMLAAGAKLVLDGSGSSDQDGAKLTYQWSVVDGGAAVKLADATREKAVVTAAAEGTAKIELVVSNGALSSQPAEVSVAVQHVMQPPVAKIMTLPATKIEIGQKITLDASPSANPENKMLAYRWTKVSGKAEVVIANADQAQAIVWASTPGTAKIELVVSAGELASAPASVELTVQKPAVPPVARIDGPDEHSVALGKTLTLTGAASTEREGAKLSYQWRQTGGDGQIKAAGENTAKLTLTPTAPGAVKIELIVNDGRANSEPAYYEFNIAQVARPPVAVAAPGQSKLNVGDKLSLDGSASANPGGGALTYKWRVISGKNAIELVDADQAKPAVIGRAAGVAKLELTVSDGKLTSAPAEVELTVEKVVQPPAAQIAALEKMALQLNEKLAVDGSRSTGEGKLTFKWRKAGGSGDVTIADDSRAKTSVIAAAPGNVTLELVVSDGTTMSAPATVKLEVLKPALPPVAKIAAPAKTKIEVGEKLDLDGSASTAEGHAPLSYKWRVASGRGDVVLFTPDQAKAAISGAKPGAVALQLTVNDGKADSAPVTVEIEVAKPAKPVEPAFVEPKKEEPKPANEADAAQKQKDDAAAQEKQKKEAEAKAKAEAKALEKQKKEEAAKAAADAKAKEEQQKADAAKAAADAKAKKEEAEKAAADAKAQEKQKKEEAAKAEAEKNAAETPKATEQKVVPPKAAITAPASDRVKVGEAITLEGAGTPAKEGAQLTYRWRYASGKGEVEISGADQSKVTLKGVTPGKVTLELVVNDGSADSKAATVSIRVEPQPEVKEVKKEEPKPAPKPEAKEEPKAKPPAPPKASIAAPASDKVKVGEEITLEGAGTSEQAGALLKYQWSKSGKGEVEISGADQSKVTLKGVTPGKVTLQLIVNDGAADSKPAMISVRVEPQSAARPVAAAVAEPARQAVAHRGTMDNVIKLDGTGSKSPLNKPLTYTWKQVGGDNLNLKAAELAKDRVGLRIFHPGTYRFELTVSDGEAKSAPAAVEVEVYEQTAPAPGAGEKTKVPDMGK